MRLFGKIDGISGIFPADLSIRRIGGWIFTLQVLLLYAVTVAFMFEFVTLYT